jgi:hypothetical protein
LQPIILVCHCVKLNFETVYSCGTLFTCLYVDDSQPGHLSSHLALPPLFSHLGTWNLTYQFGLRYKKSLITRRCHQERLKIFLVDSMTFAFFVTLKQKPEWRYDVLIMSPSNPKSGPPEIRLTTDYHSIGQSKNITPRAILYGCHFRFIDLICHRFCWKCRTGSSGTHTCRMASTLAS